LPDCAGGILVKTGEEEVKHLRVPVHWMAFDTFLDVLEDRVSFDRSDGRLGELTSGSSSQSDVLSAGNRIFVAPARRAATVFSLKPPIRRTLPVTVNSPVMATVGSREWFKAKDSKALAMVIPAEGPIGG
jgi:hypothetical protein